MSDNGVHTVPLGTLVADIKSGVSPKCERRPPGPGELGVLTLSAITKGRLDVTKAKAVPSGVIEGSAARVEKDTIIITRASGSRDLVGAVVLVEDSIPLRVLPDTAWAIHFGKQRDISSRWVFEYLRSNAGRRALLALARGTNGTFKIAKAGLRELRVPVPAEAVLPILASIASGLDSHLELLDRLIDAKRRLRDGLAAELLTGRRRLLAFAARPWRDVRLGEVSRESTRRNGERLDADRVMAVTKARGLTPMREHVMADSLLRYKVLRPGGFAYNPMRLNIGSIARSSFKRDVLVSPDYVVFEAIPDALDPRFLDYTRRTHAWRRFMAAAGSGGVRVRIYYDDLARMQLKLPDREEQSAIADVLDSAFQELACLTMLRDAIAKQKRGLMQGLLTGKIRIKEDSHG